MGGFVDRKVRLSPGRSRLSGNHALAGTAPSGASTTLWTPACSASFSHHHANRHDHILIRLRSISRRHLTA